MSLIDFEGINRAALRNGRSFLQDLVPGGKFRSLEYEVRNPTRHDKNPGSFKINYKTGVWKDFASGEGGSDLISLVAYVRGIGQAEAARELAAKLGVLPYKADAGAPSKTNGSNEHCSSNAESGAGVNVADNELVVPVPADAPRLPFEHFKLGKPTETWTYHDATGATLGYVFRFDPPARKKEFRPLTLRRVNGRLEWRWEGWPLPRPLYGLHKLAERPFAKVLVTEGEKSADAAQKLLPDYVTVTSPNGSNAADKANWSPLRGRDVVIWSDADAAGDRYRKDVIDCLTAVAVKSVAVITPPDEVKEAWDAHDALYEEGWTTEQAAQLVAKATTSDHSSEAPDRSDKTEPAEQPSVSEEDADREIRRLASLSPIQYERERNDAAKRLGMRTTILDRVVKSLPQANETSKGQGRPFEIPDTEPWPSAIDGAELLCEVTEAIKRYVILPVNSAETLALWAMHTHCFNCFAHSPRAAITSPEKGCGKTTLLDVLECLVARPLPTANATPSAIFRIVEQARPTLLIDEADTFLKENDELRGILNTGHRRGGQVLRTVGDDHEPRQFSTWAAAAIAMIGRLPDTLNDRSVIINLRRRKPEERVKPFRSDRADNLRVLARKMARWAHDHTAALTAADPDMGELINRVADNWRPLFAIADVTGGHWPNKVREIAAAADKASSEQSASVLLLQDIRWIFDGRPEIDDDGRTVLRGVKTDRISSADLVGQLVAIEGRPWAEWRGGREITQNSLARMLDRFGIRPGTIRLHTGQTPKGYHRSAFDDAFSSYLPSQTATPPQPNSDGDFDDARTATPEQLVAVSKAPKPNNDGHCGGVAVANPPLDRLGSMVGADSALPPEPERAVSLRWRASV
jgi:putative DNA primase/helicase